MHIYEGKGNASGILQKMRRCNTRRQCARGNDEPRLSLLVRNIRPKSLYDDLIDLSHLTFALYENQWWLRGVMCWIPNAYVYPTVASPRSYLNSEPIALKVLCC